MIGGGAPYDSVYWEILAWLHHIFISLQSPKNSVQTAVREEDVAKHLSKGWRVVSVVSPKTVIMEKPLDVTKVLQGLEKALEDARKAALSE